MLCSNCSKLAVIFSSRKCKKCKSSINTNLEVICDSCSKKDNVCGICLKKINLNKNVRSCNCGRR